MPFLANQFHFSPKKLIGARTSDNLETNRVRNLGAFTCVLTLAWTVLVIYVLHAHLPTNLVQLPFENSMHIRVWASQRWNFFTESPREAVIVPYVKHNDGNWYLESKWPNFAPSNLFGLRRLAPEQTLEAALLTIDWPLQRFKSCDQDPTVCLKYFPTAASVVNDFPVRTLCGNVGFVSQPHVPLTWTLRGETPVMPSEILKLDVRCAP